MAVEFEPGVEFVAGEERILFPAGPYLMDPFHPAFDITNDGERFTMVRISDNGTIEEELIVVENFSPKIENTVANQ